MVLWSSLAFGHDTGGDVALRAFVRDGALVGAWTTSGLVLHDPDGVWRRVCNESFDASDVWLADDGVFWLATGGGLIAAADGGCAREVLVPEPTSRVSEDGWVLVGRTSGDALLDPDLVEIPMPPAPLEIGSFGFAADGALWVAPSFDAAGLWTSPDRGASWAFVDSPEPDALNVEVLGPTAAGVALAVWHADGRAVIYRGGADGWDRDVELPLIPESFACDGPRCAAGLGLALVGWEDGGLTVVDGPPRGLSYTDGAWWGCLARGADGLVATSADGITFAPVLDRFEIVDRACPAGTVAALCPVPSNPPPPPPVVDAPAECGCAHGGSSAWVWVVLALGRRRG